MSNFVYDETPLSGGKSDRTPLPPGENPQRWIQAADWNPLVNAAYDLRGTILNNLFFGLTPQVTNPAIPAGASPYLLWVRNSDKHLIYRKNGVDVDLTGGVSGVTSVATGNGLTGGPITTSGTINLLLNAGGGLSKTLGAGTNELGIVSTGVVAGTYGNFTVNALGQSTAATIYSTLLNTTPPTPSSGSINLYSLANHGFSNPAYIDFVGSAWQINRDNILIVRNITGSSIAAGSVVYINGKDGATDTPTVALAQANSLTTMPAVGFVVSTITNNSYGRVITKGLFTGVIDTGLFSSGGLVYLHSSIAGGITTGQPVGVGKFQQRLGLVVNDGVGGSILVDIDINHGGHELQTNSNQFLIGDNSTSAKVAFNDPAVNVGVASGSSSLLYTANPIDAAITVSHDFDTTTAQTIAGSRLFRIRNAGVTKFSVDYTGKLTANGTTLVGDITQSGGTVGISPNGSSFINVTSGNLTLDAAGSVNIGTSASTSINIGHGSTELVNYNSISLFASGIYVNRESAFAVSPTYDGYCTIQRTDGAGSFPFDQAGSFVFRTQLTNVAGRSTHYFYTGSGPTLAMAINESQTVKIAGTLDTLSATDLTIGGTATNVKFGSNIEPVIDNVYALGTSVVRFAEVAAFQHIGEAQSISLITATPTTINATNGEIVTLTAPNAGSVGALTLGVGEKAQRITLILIQGTSGAVTWPTTITNCKLIGGTFTKTTSANAIDSISFMYNGTVWYQVAPLCASLS